jgi:hypothetical protein
MEGRPVTGLPMFLKICVTPSSTFQLPYAAPTSRGKNWYFYQYEEGGVFLVLN